MALDDAQATYARDLSLGDTIARIVLEDAARAVQTTQQEVARQTALLDAAHIQLADFTVRAPLAGTVLALTVDPGQSVVPTTVLMTLADLSRLEVETVVGTRIMPPRSDWTSQRCCSLPERRPCAMAA